jgi:outer membrane protein insertion porin family
VNKYIIYSLLVLISVVGWQHSDAQTGTALGGTTFSYKNPKPYTIAQIRFEGNLHYDAERLSNMSGLRQGKTITIPGDDVSSAIQKLWKQKVFSDVQIVALKTIGSDIWLKVIVKEKEKLSRYGFRGDPSKSEADNLREALALKKGMRVDENTIHRIKRVTKSYYINKGFYNCKVDVIKKLDTLLGNDLVQLVIPVEKGERVKIREIIIEGADEISAEKLLRKMKKTKRIKWWRFFAASKFLPTEYRNDKEKIISYYHSQAYRDAELIFDTVYRNEEDNTLSIHLKIDEGSQFYLRNISWVGNSKYRSGQLDTILGIERGDKYSQGILDTRLFMNPSGTDVSSLYMDDGYLFFSINPVEVMVENDSVDLEMRIYEGKQAIVNRIIIKGNDRTSEHVVRREIRTKPGDLFNRNDAIRTQQLLSQLGYFNPETLGIEPVPNQQDGTVDITYTVEERPSDQIELSGGWGAGRVVGTLGVSFNNFSMRKLFKLKEWKPLPSGDGQRLSLRAQSNGIFFQSYNFSFTEPWLGKKRPNSFSFTGWHSVQSLNGLPKSNPARSFIKIYGASAGLGVRLKRPDEYFNFYSEMSYQYYVLQNFGSVFSFSEGYANNLSLRFSLSRNSIDQPIYPRSGSSIQLSYKFTPIPFSLFDGIDDYSDVPDQEKFKWLEYNKIKFSSSFFTTLSKDRKLVLNARMGFGILQSWNKNVGASPFERFYLGGSGLTGFNLDGREIIALRGYGDNLISPSQGGLLISKYTVELRYPLSLNPNATIYGLAFAEAGNTWNDWKKYNPFEVKRSAGVGIRIFLPMFGLMGLDYGWGFDQYDQGSQGYGTQTLQNIRKGQFHFTIGMNLGEL